jgi:anti-sigma regulatory factor (Ser/Thr protein kinase)
MTTTPPDSLFFRIGTASDVGRSVVAVSSSALLRGANDIDRALVATMVSELCTNIIKYAERGTIRLLRREDDDGVCIEIEAQDNGPGIADIALATSDHFSTGGTLGLGLPSVRRMADDFELTSSPGAGTQVRAVKRIIHRSLRNSSSYPGVPATPGPERSQPANDHPDWNVHEPAVDIASRARPRTGELVSGDRALSLPCDGGLLLGILDASGHGTTANALAEKLEECFLAEGSSDLERLMRRFDETARGTLGAAAGLAFVAASTGNFSYVGVGNTRAAQFGATPWRGISRDGLLGSHRLHVTAQTGKLAPRDVLMLWTDGLPESGQSARSAVSSYRTAAEIASKAVTEFARDYDDAACLVLRWRP